jgi:XTP/dITP diphosphohydrolase
VLGKAERVGVAPEASALVDVTGAQTEAELGDQLLAIVAVARDRGLDPERALRGALRDFQDRVRAAEQ